MTVTQLEPTIPLDTPRGRGRAFFLLDYGEEHHLLWIVFLDETGECWTFANPDVRLSPNQTMGVRSMTRQANPTTIAAASEKPA